MKYLAHTKDCKSYTTDDECQTLAEHLETTASYAKERAEVFGAGEAAELIGLLHDVGKYSKEFQDKIRGKKISVQHAISGAGVLQKYDEITKLYGIIIASHHTGLCNMWIDASKDNDTYYGKLNHYNVKSLPYENEISLPEKISHKSPKNKPDNAAFYFATYLRMLFSVLVDSDFTETEEFCTGVKRDISFPDMNELFIRLMDKIPRNDGRKINQIRADILANCLTSAEQAQGLFSLTVPTGGGKTLSSLAFTLKHACTHGLRRVIYVIPYTSIIEQNAEVIRKILGDDNVLEHHSNLLTDNDEDLDIRAKWATENWEIPIVITTNVQFFESLFACKTTRSRKVHNITNSVIIFDEAQMLPTDYISPCMTIISELIENYRITAVLCSATQPLVQKYIFKSITTTEIVNCPEDLSEQLKRVEYCYLGKKTDEEIMDELNTLHSALVIVNSRKHAFTLYHLAKKSIPEDCLFYLSTLLTPIHRTEKIKMIKERLKQNLPVIVISTQLIEAGVDVDFPVVYRSLAGIDSIIQAGGRANREGKLAVLGKVMVFESVDFPVPKSLMLTASIGKEVIDCLGDKAFSLEGIEQYFKLLYNALEQEGIMDKKDILKEFEISRGKIVKMNFETVAKKFKLIENNTHSIVIPCRESNSLLKQLKNNEFTNRVLRKLQRYSVSIYDYEYKRLCEAHAIEIVGGVNLLNAVVQDKLVTSNYYSFESGLDIFSSDNRNAECLYI